MDEQKDLSVSNEEVLDNGDSSVNDEVPNVEENADSSVNDEVPNVEENADTSNVNDDRKSAGNGYRGLASSNREAFSRGLSDNYNERIARNQANLNASRARAASSHKMKEGHEDENMKANAHTGESNFEDKTKLDKAKDKVDVLRDKGELAASKIDKARAGMYAVTNPKEAAKMAIKAKIRTWILASIVPITIGCLSLFVLFVGVLFVLGLFEFESQASGGNVVYESSCNYENTKVTVMDSTNTKVLATVNLEDYILGVVCPEISACSGNVKNIPEHYLKTKFVATRTYVLSRANYNSSTKSIMIRATTRDQQWCDLETGCIVTEDPELVPGSDAHFRNTYPGDYPEEQMIGEIKLKYYYTEEDLELLRKYYKETYGELYLSPDYKDVITTLDYRNATEYKSGTQLFWKKEAENGKLYSQILELTGTSGEPDAEDYVGKTIYKLRTYCAATNYGSSGLEYAQGEMTYLTGGLQIPIYYQDDYKDVVLGEKNGEVAVVSEAGCGFTSSAMIVSYLLDKKITPREFVDDWSRKYYVWGQGMSWALPNAAAEHYGLGSVKQTTNADEMIQALKDGHPVMSSQGPGLFTIWGHLIVLRGVTPDGKILVNDPYKGNAVNKKYNSREFTLSEIEKANKQYFIWPKKDDV